jgi:hypothetical protein
MKYAKDTKTRMEWGSVSGEQLNIQDEYFPEPDEEEVRKFEMSLSMNPLEISTTSSSENNSSD